jgi:hypothetical protein
VKQTFNEDAASSGALPGEGVALEQLVDHAEEIALVALSIAGDL